MKENKPKPKKLEIPDARDRCGIPKSGKKPYETPKAVSEKIYEINALKCGKCESGPFHQFACVRYSKNS